MKNKIPSLIIGGVNQIILSGSNFLIAYLLIRNLPVQEFGRYSTLLPVALFASATNEALIGTQFQIFYSRLKKDRGLVLVSIQLSSIVILVFVALGLLFGFYAELGIINLSFCLFMGLLVIRDFVIRVMYSMGRLSLALKMNLIYFFTSIPFINYSKNLSSVFFILSVALGVALLSVIPREFNCESKLRRREIFHLFFANGKYNLLSNILLTIKAQSFIYIAAVISGTALVAEMNASRFLISPIILIIPIFSQILFPKFIQMQQDGISEIKKLKSYYYILWIMAAVISAALIMKNVTFLTREILGEGYLDAVNFVSYWILFALFQTLKGIAELEMKLSENFKGILLGNSAGVLVLVFSVLAVLAFGLDLQYIILGMAVCELTVSIYFTYRLKWKLL